MANKATNNKNEFNWSKWSLIIGIPITIILAWGFGHTESFTSTCSFIWNRILGSIYFWVSMATLVIIYFVFMDRTKKLTSYKKQIQTKNTELVDVSTKLEETQRKINILESKYKPYIKRWEELNQISFGSLHYPPMLDFTATGEPTGIGINILRRIFDGNLKRKYEKVTWSKLRDSLYEKDNNGKFKIDLIATPIFETNDRSKQLAFSLPIFYSEIGLYYNAQDVNFKDLPRKSFSDAINYIHNLKDDSISAYCIEGEISHRMLIKYFKSKISSVAKRHELSIQDLIMTIVDDERNSDIVFTETYQANLIKKLKIEEGDERFENLKNLLKPKQLLYPVVFAMRKEDYVLKNYINLKLIEIDGPGSGIVKLIKDSLSTINPFFDDFKTDDEKEKFINEYFIREYQHLV